MSKRSTHCDDVKDILEMGSSKDPCPEIPRHHDHMPLFPELAWYLFDYHAPRIYGQDSGAWQDLANKNYPTRIICG